MVLTQRISSKKEKKNKVNYSCVYTGSFYKGKGLEFILKLSKLLPKVNFYFYGDISTLDKKNLLYNQKNVYFKKSCFLR